jgi:hypothetical protein
MSVAQLTTTRTEHPHAGSKAVLSYRERLKTAELHFIISGQNFE